MPRSAASAKAVVLRWMVLIILSTGAWMASYGLYAQVASAGEYDYVPGEVLVKFKPGTPKAKINQLNGPIGGQIIGAFPADPDLYHIKIPEAVGSGSAVSYYNSDDAVEYAELNMVYYPVAIPNDPFFSQQYALSIIQAPGAWDFTIGDYGIVVADTDTGIDYNHPDLGPNLWTNSGEICGNGIDDDGNGLVDDCFGWDFSTNTSDPLDANGHGSHTAGIMGAVGNNGIGVAGVNWNVSIMPLKMGNGSFSSTASIRAIDYAWSMGAWVINASWGGGGFNQSLKNAIDRAGAAGALFVAAAGNNGRNNDVTPFYPANYDSPNIIAVAATTSTDARWTGSNYGARTVHLGAPGASVLSTWRSGQYARATGTSMAAPHVAGAAALIWSYNPNLSAADVKSIILNSVDIIPALQGRTITGGRLNLSRALQNTPAP